MMQILCIYCKSQIPLTNKGKSLCNQVTLVFAIFKNCPLRSLGLNRSSSNMLCPCSTLLLEKGDYCYYYYAKESEK